jgi:hypothetical protein
LQAVNAAGVFRDAVIEEIIATTAHRLKSIAETAARASKVRATCGLTKMGLSGIC